MSSNAIVATINPDQTYTSIYCHYDGDPEGVGKSLHAHYNTYEKISNLISYGDASSIEDLIEESTFYFRDEKEDWEIVKPTNFKELDHLLAHKKSWMFLYLFDGKEWWYATPGSKHLLRLEDYFREND